MSNNKNIPNYVFDDLLFRRRLERTLNAELERFNALLEQQIVLIEKRRESLGAVSSATAEKLSREEERDDARVVSTRNVLMPGSDHAER